MLCSFCQKENREHARFCDGCGGTLDATIQKTGVDPELDAIRKAFSERYVVESLLGRGGMGSVYKARERELDRYVALKIVPEHRSKDAAFIERFRREARIAARLRHPRIVSVHEVGTMEPFPYFSMDYIEGGTLRSVVQRRRSLPAEDAISIVVEICRAVAHAHGKGVIHRDLKPENVMIDGEGDVFVMDFGLARATEDVALTQSGTIMGTPFYMSPEQLSGKKLDERSDIYSIGLILHYCFTGEELFAAESVPAVVAKHTTINTRNVIQMNARIPTNLQEILVSMLDEDVNARSRTVKEILERLTLRRIVALGLGATEDRSGSSPSVATTITEPAPEKESSFEDSRLVVAAERRKARLRSLLDEF